MLFLFFEWSWRSWDELHITYYISQIVENVREKVVEQLDRVCGGSLYCDIQVCRLREAISPCFLYWFRFLFCLRQKKRKEGLNVSPTYGGHPTLISDIYILPPWPESMSAVCWPNIPPFLLGFLKVIIIISGHQSIFLWRLKLFSVL